MLPAAILGYLCSDPQAGSGSHWNSQHAGGFREAQPAPGKAGQLGVASELTL